MDKKSAEVRQMTFDDALHSDTGEISCTMVGAGIGAIAAVPALTVLLSYISLQHLSDTVLVLGALAAPVLGGVLGAIVGWLVSLAANNLLGNKSIKSAD